jgi:hypothetical protein
MTIPIRAEGVAVFLRRLIYRMHANGEDVKVVQELLRHGSAWVTSDVYAQAITPAKRTAQGNMVAMLRDEDKKAARNPDACISVDDAVGLQPVGSRAVHDPAR